MQDGVLFLKAMGVKKLLKFLIVLISIQITISGLFVDGVIANFQGGNNHSIEETFMNTGDRRHIEQNWRIELVSSTVEEIVLDVFIDNISMVEKDVEGRLFYLLYLSNGGSTTDIGKPAIPTFGQHFAIPQGATVKLELLKSNSDRYNDILVYPAQEPQVDSDFGDSENSGGSSFEIDTDFYEQDILYPENIVDLDDISTIRGVLSSIIRFYPAQYNPKLRELTVYSYIRVRISFMGGSGKFRDPSKSAESFESMYSGLFINYKDFEPIGEESNVENNNFKDRKTFIDFINNFIKNLALIRLGIKQFFMQLR